MLENISAKIATGFAEKKLQTTPHLVLLNRDFYSKELLPLFSQWLALFVATHKVSTGRAAQA